MSIALAAAIKLVQNNVRFAELVYVCTMPSQSSYAPRLAVKVSFECKVSLGQVRAAIRLAREEKCKPDAQGNVITKAEMFCRMHVKAMNARAAQLRAARAAAPASAPVQEELVLTTPATESKKPRNSRGQFVKAAV